MHLLIVRHGERRFGELEHHDLGLTDRGRQQSQQLACWLVAEGWRLTSLSSSTLPRAHQTAEIIAATIAIAVQDDPRLREVGGCDPAGAEIADSAPPPYGFAPREHPGAAVRPGGESWTQFRRRVAAVLRDLLVRQPEPYACVGLICHSGVHNAAYEVLEGLDRVSRVEWAVAHTGLTHFEHTRGAWVLRAHNVTHHLASAPSRPPR